jgi:hypothetical protein
VPYPGEYAARIHDPDKYKLIHRQNNKFGDGIDAIFGVLPDGNTEVQALRFKVDKFKDREDVKNWLKEHDYETIMLEDPKSDREEKSTRHDSATDLVEVRRTPEGYLDGRSRVTRAGVLLYRNPDGSLRRELRHPEDVFAADSLASLRMIPITVQHPPVPGGLLTAETTGSFQVGFTGESVAQDGDYVNAAVKITAKPGVVAVDQGLDQISLGYSYVRDYTPGVYRGEEYDCRQLDIRYNHGALVRHGRAGPEVRLQVATDGLEYVDQGADVVSHDTNLNSNERTVMSLVKIALDGGLQYEVPPEVEVAVKKLQTALDEAGKERVKLTEQVSALTGERDTLKSQLQTALDAQSDEAVRKLVTERVQLERVALDFLDEEAQKAVPTLTTLDLKKLVIKSQLPDVNLDQADPSYIAAAFDTVVNLHNMRGDGSGKGLASIAGDNAKKLGGDLLRNVAKDGAVDHRKAMIDRMINAYKQ